MIVFNHTHKDWLARYRRHGRTNGAFTYSRDIARWHFPIWRELLSDDQSVATCGVIPGATVQYLHERTHPELSGETRLFVTTYKDLADALGRRGLWLPNLIDRDTLPRAAPTEDWAYFGNVIDLKRRAFSHIKALASDVVSGEPDQSAALARVARHRFGIGVGRCALEMMAMGMKVMIYGKDFGGLILTEDDFRRQSEANFNGNIITGATCISDAARRISEARHFPVTFQERQPEFRQRIIEAWRKVG